MALKEELDLDRPFQDFRHEAVLNIIHTAGILSSTGSVLMRRFGLTGAQFNVLFALKFKTRAITQSELGRRLVVTRASITSVLDKLEGKGLVKRVSVPKNRRIYHVELTEKGRELIDELEPQYRESLHEATVHLSEQDCRTLIGLLERVRTTTGAVYDAMTE
jgi:MarR family 2-MHQ and catechol resistance regulon transcriptional repressor